MTGPAQDPAGRLAPGIAEYLRRADELFRHDAVDMTTDAQRRMFRELCRAFAGPRPAELTVRDESLPGPHGEVGIRIYRPAGKGAMPGLVYFHGGGWVVGDLDSHDDHCAWIAENSRIVVVSVDYPLSPENVHPVPFEASRAAYLAILDRAGLYGVDPARLAIGGDSAGACIAAAVTLWLRDSKGPTPALQLLIYPALGSDLTLPSFVENADAPALTTSDMAKYLRLYTGREPSEIDDPYAVPLLSESLSGLPPAALFACELDPLRDEARAWHERLRAEGVQSEYYLGAGLVHGCLRARRMSPAAMAFFEAICAAARELNG